ncbi:unnamed protein product, partial [Medioppia subpectinata]
MCGVTLTNRRLTSRHSGSKTASCAATGRKTATSPVALRRLSALEKARTCLRLTAIQYFGDYLCGIVDPYLKYDVEMFAKQKTNNTVNIGANESSDKTPEQMEIEKLWSLQEKLKKAKDRQEIMKQTVDAVLNEENQSKPSRIVIQPRYVVPDTNCYIDQLDKIKRII